MEEKKDQRIMVKYDGDTGEYIWEGNPHSRRYGSQKEFYGDLECEGYDLRKSNILFINTPEAIMEKERSEKSKLLKKFE